MPGTFPVGAARPIKEYYSETLKRGARKEMIDMTEEERQARAERQRRHPVWRTRRAGGMTVATFSHWSDEEDPRDREKREHREQEQE